MRPHRLLLPAAIAASHLHPGFAAARELPDALQDPGYETTLQDFDLPMSAALAKEKTLLEQWRAMLLKAPNDAAIQAQVDVMGSEVGRMHREVLGPGEVLLGSGSLFKLIPQSSRPSARDIINRQCNSLMLTDGPNKRRHYLWVQQLRSADRQDTIRVLPPSLQTELAEAFEATLTASNAAASFCGSFSP